MAEIVWFLKTTDIADNLGYCGGLVIKACMQKCKSSHLSFFLQCWAIQLLHGIN